MGIVRFLAPKIAVPTRTSVAPSSTATSKSWLIPIESSLQLRSVDTLGEQILADRPKAPEERTRLFGVVDGRW